MRYLISSFFAAMVVFGSVSAWANTSSKESHMLMELKSGTVKIALRDDLAPNHVERIKQLVSEKFYDGIIFHRVIDGFMAKQVTRPAPAWAGRIILICVPSFPANPSAAAHWAWRAHNTRTVPTASSSSAFRMLRG